MSLSWFNPLRRYKHTRQTPTSGVVAAWIGRKRDGSIQRVRFATGEARSLLLAEYNALQEVTHEHLVKYRWSGVGDGRFYVATSWIDVDARKDWPIPIPTLLSQMECASRGVVALHAKGLVQGDLKRETILWDGDRAIVTDLKLAAKAGRRDASYSPKFAAPEQILKESVRVWCDQQSVIGAALDAEESRAIRRLCENHRMLISAAPGVLLWPAAMIVWGPGYVSSRHAHHCVQLVMTMRGTLRIRGNVDDLWISCGAALVKPDARHEVDARDMPVLIAFVDSESELGAALSEKLKQDITPIGVGEVSRWRRSLGNPAALSASQVEPWVRRELLSGRGAPKIHPRVKRVLRFLREQLGTTDALSLGNLADIAGLSRSRLGHVFTESVGVPLRPYILWLRLQRASGELMRGATATEAAHRAGFSDAAHMTRTFRRMLGTTPSELAERRQRSRGTFMQAN